MHRQVFCCLHFLGKSAEGEGGVHFRTLSDKKPNLLRYDVNQAIAGFTGFHEWLNFEIENTIKVLMQKRSKPEVPDEVCCFFWCLAQRNTDTMVCEVQR